MSFVYQLVPIFLVVQFGIVLAALAAAMLMADPQTLLAPRKSRRRNAVRPVLDSRNRSI